MRPCRRPIAGSRHHTMGSSYASFARLATAHFPTEKGRDRGRKFGEDGGAARESSRRYTGKKWQAIEKTSLQSIRIGSPKFAKVCKKIFGGLAKTLSG